METFENVYEGLATLEIRVKVRIKVGQNESAYDILSDYSPQEVLKLGEVIGITEAYIDDINLIGTTENVSYDLEYREQERETRATAENV